jgi:hypothetical protein
LTRQDRIRRAATMSISMSEMSVIILFRKDAMLNVIAMPRAWEDGITWAVAPPWDGPWLQRRLRAIDRLKGELAAIREPGALLARSSSLAWLEAERLAAQNPTEWRGVNRAMVAQAAYGLRYVELVTGREIPCRWPFPAWLRDWTTR